MNKLMFAGVLATVVTAPLFAQSFKSEDQIGFRKATFKFYALNVARIKANLEGNFDINVVKTSANALAGAAQTKVETLFGEGSDKSSTQKTEAKPEVWLKKDEFDKLAQKNRDAADALVVAVQSGDKSKIAEAFGNLGKSCKACHDDFKAK